MAAAGQTSRRRPTSRASLLQPESDVGQVPSVVEDRYYEAYIRLLRGDVAGRKLDEALVRGYLVPKIRGSPLLLATNHEDEVLGHAPYRLVDARSHRPVPRLSEIPIVVRFFADKYWQHCLRRGTSLSNRLHCAIVARYLGAWKQPYTEKFLIEYGYLDGSVRESADDEQAVGVLEPAPEAPQPEAPPVHASDTVVPPKARTRMGFVGSEGLLKVSDLRSDGDKSRSTGLIADERYDLIVAMLNGNMPQAPVGKQVLAEARRFLRSYSERAQVPGQPPRYTVRTENWADGGDGILPGGWRIIEMNTNRAYPRKSEGTHILSSLWQGVKEDLAASANNRLHFPAKFLLKRVSQLYAGFGSGRVDKFVEEQELPVVKFPARPQHVAERPMQFVQVDVIEMEKSASGSHSYDHLLLVRCLFSNYFFGRALIGTDKPLITRHLVDMFVHFGPPQSFQSYTNRELVEECMAEVATVFGVNFASFGRIREKGTSHYRIRSICYDKATEMRGAVDSWVECLPFALMQANQMYLRSGLAAASPFEMMFARRPWPGCETPPWIAANECESADDSASAKKPLRSQMNTVSSLSNAVLIRQQRWFMKKQRELVAFLNGDTSAETEECALGTPPTSVRFLAGDDVFVRVGERSADADEPDERPHFRGQVVSARLELPLPYRVQLVEPDQNGSVPTVASSRRMRYKGEENSIVEVGHFDIVGRTRALQRRRLVILDGESKKREFCQCADVDCRLPPADGRACKYRMSADCCRREQPDCPKHQAAATATDAAESSRVAPDESIEEESPPMIEPRRRIRASANSSFSELILPSDADVRIDEQRRARLSRLAALKRNQRSDKGGGEQTGAVRHDSDADELAFDWADVALPATAAPVDAPSVALTAENERLRTQLDKLHQWIGKFVSSQANATCETPLPSQPPILDGGSMNSGVTPHVTLCTAPIATPKAPVGTVKKIVVLQRSAHLAGRIQAGDTAQKAARQEAVITSPVGKSRVVTAKWPMKRKAAQIARGDNKVPAQVDGDADTSVASKTADVDRPQPPILDDGSTNSGVTPHVTPCTAPIATPKAPVGTVKKIVVLRRSAHLAGQIQAGDTAQKTRQGSSVRQEAVIKSPVGKSRVATANWPLKRKAAQIAKGDNKVPAQVEGDADTSVASKAVDVDKTTAKGTRVMCPVKRRGVDDDLQDAILQMEMMADD